MTDAYGFGAKSKPGESGAVDLSNIPTGPSDVDPAREADALARGEQLGFISREISGGNIVRPRGRPRKMEPKSITIRGPREVIDRFINFTNEAGYGSYWEAIEYLMRDQGAGR